jgi:hypothetical protein
VRVHGTVRERGLPLAEHDVAFEPRAGGSDDWDFTDAHGRYEVRLAPGVYRVTLGGREHTAELAVPAGASELRAELDLP